MNVLLGALHATEHAQIAVLPLIAMCDRWDIGGLSTNYHHETGCPTIFIYDGHPGGIGITRRGYLAFEALVDDAHRLVSEEVVAFQKKRISDHEVLDLLPVDLPEQRFVTQALWYVLPDSLLRDEFPLDALQGSLHAAEHAQIAVLPLIAMCDRWDIGGLSTAFHHQTGRATIFIYDGHPGGVGITRTGFEWFERLVDDAVRLIAECPCRSGCPSCVQSPKCGNLNEPLNKNGALELMTRMQAA